MPIARRGRVTPELVGQLSELSGLPLSRERQEALMPFLRDFLEGMARLEEVDVSKCEPPVAFESPADR
jgi:Asp-tRNA(Asn)/Glu-tRNA(Gln) amidotransferase C subunit